ncbi:MAG: hypothetical protein ACREPX_07945, partial [Rhodanobacteraceae bacterium]
MKFGISTRMNWVVVFAAATALLAGCGKSNDAVPQANKKEETKGVAVPSVSETKAIAEEAFVYGLPIVMNYAVMYE